MRKRNLGKEEGKRKRFKLNEDDNELWSENDDEQLMCDAADEVERQLNDTWSDSDDEHLMCDAADEIEKQLHDEWGDSDDEQLMCNAVDEWERVNQLGCGQPRPAEPVQAPSPGPVQPPQQPEPVQASLNDAITSSSFIPTNNQDLLAAFRELEHQVQEELRRRLNRNRGIRAYITVDANYTRESVDGTQRIIQHFRSIFMV